MALGSPSNWRLLVEYLTRAGQDMPEHGGPSTTLLTISDPNGVRRLARLSAFYCLRRVCTIRRLSHRSGRFCCLLRVVRGLSGCSGRPIEASEVIRKLLRIGANGLYAIKDP
jgi:hypothetical protein